MGHAFVAGKFGQAVDAVFLVGRKAVKLRRIFQSEHFQAIGLQVKIIGGIGFKSNVGNIGVAVGIGFYAALVANVLGGFVKRLCAVCPCCIFHRKRWRCFVVNHGNKCLPNGYIIGFACRQRNVIAGCSRAYEL